MKMIDNQTKSVKVGVEYTSKSIKRTLEKKYKEIETGFTCTGLLLKGIEENNFRMEALLYNKKSNTFKIKDLESDVENPTYLSNENGDNQLRKTDSFSRPKSIQFWDSLNSRTKMDTGPFVYFGRHTLQLLTIGDVESVTFSGAMVDYGVGIRNYESAVNEKSTAYPTLKAEVNLGISNNNRYIPTVALGLPCPPQWSDGEGQVKLSNNNVRFLAEIKSNFNEYGETTRFIKAEEPTFEEMIESWNILKIN